MKYPEKQLKDIFDSLLATHIATKSTASQFHEKSSEWYEFALEVRHSIGEKFQDIEQNDPIGCDDASDQAYNNLCDLKCTLETMAKENKDIWLDNLLRWLIDKAQSHCGNARAFVNEEKEEEEDKIETKWMALPPKK